MTSSDSQPITSELEEFILWFLALEQIDIEIRRDMCQHLLEQETIEQKSIDFILDILGKLFKESYDAAQYLGSEIIKLDYEIAEKKKLLPLWKQSVIKSFNEFALTQAESYIADVHKYERKLDKDEESLIQEEESASIESIKSDLLS